MEEIEVKILDINVSDIILKLEKLGAKKVFDGELYALYFDDENDTLKKNHEVLRLRKEGNIAVLCKKKIISKKEAKIAHEEEEIVDFDTKYNELIAQGYTPKFTLKKHRESYKLKDTKIEIDTFKGKYSFVPPFLEVEAPNMNKLEKTVKKLGYTMKQTKPWSGKDVIKHYQNKK